jgi:putative oxidoreductase
MSMLKSLSRLLLSGIFISGGADAFLKPGGRVNKVAAFDIPEAEQAVKLNGATMVFAGTALALGIAPKVAATVLIGCLIPTTIVGHPFWKEEDSGSRKNQQVQFLKNLGLMGGLLLVLLEKNK